MDTPINHECQLPANSVAVSIIVHKLLFVPHSSYLCAPYSSPSHLQFRVLLLTITEPNYRGLGTVRVEFRPILLDEIANLLEKLKHYRLPSGKTSYGSSLPCDPGTITRHYFGVDWSKSRNTPSQMPIVSSNITQAEHYPSTRNYRIERHQYPMPCLVHLRARTCGNNTQSPLPHTVSTNGGHGKVSRYQCIAIPLFNAVVASGRHLHPIRQHYHHRNH